MDVVRRNLSLPKLTAEESSRCTTPAFAGIVAIRRNALRPGPGIAKKSLRAGAFPRRRARPAVIALPLATAPLAQLCSDVDSLPVGTFASRAELFSARIRPGAPSPGSSKAVTRAAGTGTVPWPAPILFVYLPLVRARRGFSSGCQLESDGHASDRRPPQSPCRACPASSGSARLPRPRPSAPLSRGSPSSPLTA